MVTVHCANDGQSDATAVGTACTSPARQTDKVKITVVPCAEDCAEGGVPQFAICTRFSVSGEDVLGASPLEFASGLYAATRGVLPDPSWEIVRAHEPVPAEVEVKVAGQESLKLSEAVTEPVGGALPDAACTLKFTVTGFPTKATFVGKEKPLKLELVEVMVVVVLIAAAGFIVSVGEMLPVHPF